MLLELEQVVAGYGRGGNILNGVDLAVDKGELVCLIGPNGAGKSTVLRAVSGLIPTRSGSIRLEGREIGSLSPQALLHLGISHVAQGRTVFPGMTVRENVLMGGYSIRDPKLLRQRLAFVQELFPIVVERANDLAGNLSGGQQQLVEMARALMLAPKVLLLDEPSLGLEPRLSDLVFQKVRELCQAGVAVLMVEQNARRGLMHATRGYVLELGRVRLEGPGPSLLDNPEVKRLYLGESGGS
ncbi:MAG: ABC transporter ATP-binding protein [Clostridia bacterium]|nr:ABC transporter ATP-binding protein [Clostridia bacterium]